MMIQNLNNLPADLRQGLLEGYHVPEMENYRIQDELRHADITIELGSKTLDKLDEYAAYLHGVELRAKILLMFSADHFADLRKDIINYNLYAERLNVVYGKIAVTCSANRSLRKGVGIIGHLITPFQSVETEIYNRKTQETSYSIQFPQAALDIKNEQVRKAHEDSTGFRNSSTSE